MLATIRYTQGLGNNAIYVRFRDPTRYWNFATGMWVTAETSECRAFLAEYDDADPYYSRYFAVIAAPTGVLTIAEYVRVSDETTIAEDDPQFYPATATPVPPSSTTAVLNQNYGGPGALIYRTPSGVPIENAAVRVFHKTAFDVGDLSAPLGTTSTDAAGNWVDPIIVPVGETYVVQFQKNGAYGPDHVEVVV